MSSLCENTLSCLPIIKSGTEPIFTVLAFVNGQRTIDFFSIVSHVTLTNGFFPSYINDIIGVEWFMIDLIIFIAMVPFMRLFIPHFREATYALGVSIIASAALTVSYNLIYPADEAAGVVRMYFDSICFIKQLPVFLLGVWLYHVYTGCDTRIPHIIGKLSSFSLGLLILTLVCRRFISGVDGGIVFGALCTSFFMAVGMLLIHLLYKKKPGLFSAVYFKPLTLLGKYSLGIYLLHMLPIRFLKYSSICHESCVHSIIGWTALLVAILIVSFIFSYLIENLIRKIACFL